MMFRGSMSVSLAFAVCAALTAVAPAALGQGFNNRWATFANESSTRLSLPGTSISGSNFEVDFEVGDLDKNGFEDLVVVRKTPFTVYGEKTNLLLMNENGVLTDRTAQFATASDVAGDQGFLTPTNDRHLAIDDFDGDGWLDIVTSTALGYGKPKHISHPRYYRNLGKDGGGQWLGLKFENARIPQFIHFGTGLPQPPAFCFVVSGDIDNDGDKDLYFSDYDTGEVGVNVDLNERLLINDGTGFFVDQTQLRLPAAYANTGFGTSAAIADLTLSGRKDIVNCQAGSSDVAYNNPANVGHYLSPSQNVSAGAAYHMSLGDLNNDSRPDAIISDDGNDHYRYNTGTDVLGRVIWGSVKTFQFLSGSDDGFGANSLTADLDNDGYSEVIIADVDIDIPGCGRRIHLYHNPGGAVGSQITLREERESAAASSWVGAVGITSNDLVGGYDIAALDIDADGLKDLVFGRCGGTSVWMNQGTCQANLGSGGPGSSALTACGGDLATGTSVKIALSGAPASKPAFLIAGLTNGPTFVPALGGTLVPLPAVVVAPVVTDAAGKFLLPNVPGGGGPFSAYVQMVVQDPAQVKGYGLSNAVRLDFKP